MDTEAAPSRPSQRPRPWLLVLLGVVLVAGLMAYLAGNSATPGAPSSNPANPAAQNRRPGQPIDPAALAVNLEALEAERPAPGDSERNPFRFQPKPPPPPPPEQRETPAAPIQTGPPPPPPPPPVPPIPLKFIGIIDSPEVGAKIAAFTDCRSQYQAKEGQIIAGQYRLVRLGVESAVVEYVNGKGRTTLRMGGQECVGK